MLSEAGMMSLDAAFAMITVDGLDGRIQEGIQDYARRTKVHLGVVLCQAAAYLFLKKTRLDPDSCTPSAASKEQKPLRLLLLSVL